MSEFDYVDQIIAKYKRPITFLIIDSVGDNLSVLLAQKYPESVFVLLDGQKTFVEGEVPGNFIHLKSDANEADLKHLGECEHFDIVYVKECAFALTSEGADILYHLGERVLIDIQGDDLLVSHVLSSLFKAMDPFENTRKLFYAHHSIKFLRRNQWFEPSSEANRVREIISTDDKKFLHKHHQKKVAPSVWSAGINLVTFKMLNGAIPSRDRLVSEINRLFLVPHLDWMPNNIIVEGRCLKLIDFDDPSSEAKTVHTQHMLELIRGFVSASERDKLKDIFQEILCYCREQLHPF